MGRCRKKANSNILDIFIAELLLCQPHVLVNGVDAVEALVELKRGPKCLQKQPQFTEFQKLVAILTLTLNMNSFREMLTPPSFSYIQETSF